MRLRALRAGGAGPVLRSHAKCAYASIGGRAGASIGAGGRQRTARRRRDKTLLKLLILFAPRDATTRTLPSNLFLYTVPGFTALVFRETEISPSEVLVQTPCLVPAWEHVAEQSCTPHVLGAVSASVHYPQTKQSPASPAPPRHTELPHRVRDTPDTETRPRAETSRVQTPRHRSPPRCPPDDS